MSPNLYPALTFKQGIFLERNLPTQFLHDSKTLKGEKRDTAPQ